MNRPSKAECVSGERKEKDRVAACAHAKPSVARMQKLTPTPDDDDDVYYYIGERLKLEGETENVGVWTKKRGMSQGSMKGEKGGFYGKYREAT